jgi:centrosomal protein CEP135
MDPELQHRYFELKKQLTNLNYSANFGIDAIDIVQQLFTDLISTTESYTQLQEKEFNLSQDLSLAQAQLFPLRKENARLSRENQQLHLETIKLREELGDYKDGLTDQVRNLEDELQQYHYLVLSKDKDLERAESERLRLREVPPFLPPYRHIILSCNRLMRPWHPPLCSAEELR